MAGIGPKARELLDAVLSATDGGTRAKRGKLEALLKELLAARAPDRKQAEARLSDSDVEFLLRAMSEMIVAAARPKRWKLTVQRQDGKVVGATATAEAD